MALKDLLEEIVGEDDDKLNILLQEAEKEAKALAESTTDGLKKKRDELLEKVSAMKDKVIPEGFDLSGYESFLAEKDQLEKEKRKAEEDRLIATENWEKLKDQMNSNHQKALDALKVDKDSEINRYKSALDRELTENIAIKAIDKEKGNSTLLLPHISPYLQNAYDPATQTFSTMVVDAAGNERMDTDTGKPFTVSQLVAEFKANESYAGAFPSQNRGGGVSPTGAASYNGVANPFKKGDNYNMTEQAKIIRENPELASAMAKAAGVKLQR